MFVFLFPISQWNTFESVLLRWMNIEPIRVSPFLNNIKNVCSHFSWSHNHLPCDFSQEAMRRICPPKQWNNFRKRGHETQEKGDLMWERDECKGNLTEGRMEIQHESCFSSGHSLDRVRLCNPLDCSARELFSWLLLEEVRKLLLSLLLEDLVKSLMWLNVLKEVSCG